jgi:hypothetical protein
MILQTDSLNSKQHAVTVGLVGLLEMLPVERLNVWYMRLQEESRTQGLVQYLCIAHACLLFQSGVCVVV